MKAARVHEYGPPEVLRVEEVERPAPGPRQVLIEVHAASVNPVDCKIRSGRMRGVVRYRLPRALGLDVSGVVVEVGSRVQRFRPGDEVYGSPSHRDGGTYAEYAALDERSLAPKPARLDHRQAAALPLVSLTAWACLVDRARLAEGERVLVQAGAGGVGTAALQIARSRGAYVAATCSGRNAELCRSLGADRVIDYTREAFDEDPEGYDVVLDSLGGDALARARRVLRRGGRIATIDSGLPDRVRRLGPNLGAAATAFWMAGTWIGSRLRRGPIHHVVRPADGRKLERVTELVERGELRPVLDRVFPLEEIAEAHRASERGRTRGKIVIAVRGD